MSIRFGQVNLVVADMAASVAFYRLLEFGVPDPFEWPSGSGAQHVEIGGDEECHLALDNHAQARIWNNQFDPERGRGNVVVGLLVASRNDVDRLYAKVRDTGHPVGQEPYDASWGSRYAIVIDPDATRSALRPRSTARWRTSRRVGPSVRWDPYLWNQLAGVYAP